jgi:CBS domain-containing protein
MIVKAVIWMVSLGSGTSGGVLAPLLIMGAALGGLEASVFPHMPSGFWALASMAAILGGTMRSPLTGVVFALELTHAWGAALPLLVAVATAHGCTVLLLRRSILTEKVSRRGFHLSREYATDPLEILFVREVMRTDVHVLPASLTRAELVRAMGGHGSLRRVSYVIDEKKRLVGVVTRSRVEAWALGEANESREDDDRSSMPPPPPSTDRLSEETLRAAVTIGEVARNAHPAFGDETLRAAVSQMARTGHTRLPVVRDRRSHEIVGEITLEDTLKASVRHLEEEQRRERILPVTAVIPKWLRENRAVPFLRSKTLSQTNETVE